MNLLVIDPLQLSPAALKALADTTGNGRTRLASPSSITYMMLETPTKSVTLHESLSESQIESVQRACQAISPDVQILQWSSADNNSSD